MTELLVSCLEHEAHAALAEEPHDLVLAGDDLAGLPDGSDRHAPIVREGSEAESRAGDGETGDDGGDARPEPPFREEARLALEREVDLLLLAGADDRARLERLVTVTSDLASRS